MSQRRQSHDPAAEAIALRERVCELERAMALRDAKIKELTGRLQLHRDGVIFVKELSAETVRSGVSALEAITEERPMLQRVLNGNELADALGRHRTFVSAMKRAGFKPSLPPNFFRLDEARAWLEAHPEFRACKAWAFNNN